MKTDLHTHTWYSDGLCSPKELFSIAKGNGVTTIAVTDHDTYYHMGEARREAEAMGIKLVQGIELSCYHYDLKKKVHIVGLYLPDEAPHAESLGRQVLEGRNAYHRKMVQDICSMGYPITFEEARRYSHSATVFKIHLFQAIKGRYPEITMDFYKKHFMETQASDADLEMNYMTVEEGIRAIKQDGGVPVLAHPSLYDSFPEVGLYVDYGLEGIEVSHPSMSRKDQELARHLAGKYHLKCSGGSDFHMLGSGILPGDYAIPSARRLCNPFLTLTS